MVTKQPSGALSWVSIGLDGRASSGTAAANAEGGHDHIRSGAIDSAVRNLSETDAALDVTSPVVIPDRFTLMVDTDRPKMPCRIVSRKEKRIGVRFELG